MSIYSKTTCPILCMVLLCAGLNVASAAEVEPAAPAELPSLEQLKQTGLTRSRFHATANGPKALPSDGKPPGADLKTFQDKIKPLLTQYCYDCHSAEVMEGNFQVSSLDPNILKGKDTEWWAEVFSVVTKGEMPPPDDMDMDEADRRVVVHWLSRELEAASIVRRQSGSHSAFRRLTRYEYNYALQDLLGLPWDFAKDLPPEPHSEEGFENSSVLLHVSVSQFETYHRLAREALDKATVSGPRPEPIYWGISMKQAAEREFKQQDQQVAKAKKEHKDNPEKLAEELAKLEKNAKQTFRTPYYQQLSTGRTAEAEWAYYGARYAFAPIKTKAEFPEDYDHVAILPGGQRRNIVVELGNQIPDEGTMRVTVRASRAGKDDKNFPSLQLLFGWQASNEGRALQRVSEADVPITATPDTPQIVQWEFPLSEIYPRNSVRKTSPMGHTPSPSEYIRIANSAASASDIQIDYVCVEAPVYEQWPPKSHQQIFFESENSGDETAYAREIITRFMTRAWRRPPSPAEVDRKLKLFAVMRPQCERFEDAVLEVLATVLSSPQFLYVAQASQHEAAPIDEATAQQNASLATRLALFLWCSLPDDELIEVASTGKLTDPDILTAQVDRMLADPRSKRFSEHFVNQWLNLELLGFVNFKGLDPLLKEAMQHEPVALFEEVMANDASILDFLHADYAVVNERLARHYGLKNVYGNEFRRVDLEASVPRGGLLTQSGVLAMNSDFPDSHPLKRAIWLLECILADPPPPPPPAVPQIDLANPEIAKMTLRERMEDHRSQAACKSCHVKIDPWGLAFENFDALGKWRDNIRGKPVDASSELFNGETLEGMEGLKRFLLDNRQDQFVEATVRKMATFGLGRPLGFEDRAEIDTITAQVRQQGDGLRTVVQTIVHSDLFLSE
ncbi:DUF1592 domain-containing protein [Bremerella sp. JC817]|uniref:DUF1592 domain-containing protein n=1 Tax=Bremerella sp. JC817 TaxID=3231756 RepID=UPI00345A3EDB